ncbi:Dyp-type peroxidase [Streptomyces sp. NPDC085665]|uniref:Dyp-type peroxidase n=1 Tax=Streptomyces sp. NPDC085665 TaxID=3365735 RepID=UPI0037D7D160
MTVEAEEPGGNGPSGGRSRVARRALLGAGGLAALAAGGAVLTTSGAGARTGERRTPAVIPFHGPHQAGILTRRQPYAHLAALDLGPGTDRARAAALLRAWTEAAARMSRGEPPAATGADTAAGVGASASAGAGAGAVSAADGDTGVARDAGPASLTVTFGFGAGLFDRLGLAAARPQALAPLPAFTDDRLDPARSGGDLFVQIGADDPFVALHALRVLQRLARGAARTRWVMSGFTRPPGAPASAPAASGTHRNLMGQLDGTANPAPAEDPAQRARILVTGPDAPPWLAGGSYVVVRRIRMLLDTWEGLPVHHREEAVGRRVADGAPLTGGTERTPADLDAARPDGIPVIATNAHIRLAAPGGNAGATMLRRGWSYYDGLRPDGTPDAGLLFVAWQADPRTGFVPVQQRLSRGDALARYTEHEASALFAVAGGTAPGEYVGQGLLEG